MSDYDRYGSRNSNDPTRRSAAGDSRGTQRSSDSPRRRDTQSVQGTGSSRRVSGSTGSMPRDPGSTGAHRRAFGTTGSTRPVTGDITASGRLYRTGGYEKVGRETYARDRPQW